MKGWAGGRAGGRGEEKGRHPNEVSESREAGSQQKQTHPFRAKGVLTGSGGQRCWKRKSTNAHSYSFLLMQKAGRNDGLICFNQSKQLKCLLL